LAPNSKTLGVTYIYRCLPLVARNTVLKYHNIWTTRTKVRAWTRNYTDNNDDSTTTLYDQKK